MHMTGGEAVVRSLTAHNVSTVFGIPGTHNLAVYDALREASGIRHILARHEQGAAFMADGYARVSGQVGVCLSTTGPAALNTLASLGTAFSDSSPVLCIASQIPAAGIGLDKGFLHECSDQLASFGPVTKWSARADTVAAIPDVMREAFARMQADRPRPAAVEVPCDVLDAFDDVTIPEPAVALRPEADKEQIEQAARLLREAAASRHLGGRRRDHQRRQRRAEAAGRALAGTDLHHGAGEGRDCRRPSAGRRQHDFASGGAGVPRRM